MPSHRRSGVRGSLGRVNPTTVCQSEVEARADRVLSAGFVHLEGPWESTVAARIEAEAIARCAEARRAVDPDVPELVMVGEFVIPIEGAPRRDFQILHLDFGLPVDPRGPQDVARYTALHVSHRRPTPTASTRLVHLGALLGQRRWAPRADLVDRMLEYGSTRGGRTGKASYVEGVLARLVEAADAGTPSLPAVSEPGFLCGQEFRGLAEERAFLAARGLSSEEVEISVRLAPGALLILDNLAMAHGRNGLRETRELHQWMFGYRELGVARQLGLRDQLLDAFGSLG